MYHCYVYLHHVIFIAYRNFMKIIFTTGINITYLSLAFKISLQLMLQMLLTWLVMVVVFHIAEFLPYDSDEEII